MRLAIGLPLTAGSVSSLPDPLLCCNRSRWRRALRWRHRAPPNQNVAGHARVLRRHGERIRAGLRIHPEGLRRSYVAVEGVENIDATQLVAVPFEDSLEG
jgi:hypothetical protein